MKDINKIIAQRDQLQKILTQKDITIERLFKKLDTLRSETVLTPHNEPNEMTGKDEFAEFIDKQNNLHERIRNESIEDLSPAKIKCKHLSLECCLLKDLNKSLENENENLKTVNKILENNFHIINNRLKRVQSEHKSRLIQLYDINQLLKASIESKKRSRSSSPESQNKRRRYFNNYSKGDNGTESDSSVYDSDHDMDESTSSDVLIVETNGDNVVDLVGDSDADNDTGDTDKKVESLRSENIEVNGSCDNHLDRVNVQNDDLFVGRNTIETLSQPNADTKLAETTKESPILDEHQATQFLTMESKEENL